jgi:hypothetical protein
VIQHCAASCAAHLSEIYGRVDARAMLRHLQGMMHLSAGFQALLDRSEGYLDLMVARARGRNINHAYRRSKFVIDPVRKLAKQQSRVAIRTIR